MQRARISQAFPQVVEIARKTCGAVHPTAYMGAPRHSASRIGFELFALSRVRQGERQNAVHRPVRVAPAPSQTRARAPCARCSSSTRGATDAGLRGLGAAGTSVAIMACAVVVIAVVVDGADGIDGADAEVIDGIEGAGATGVVDVAGVGAAGDADAAGDASSGMRGSVTSVMACLSQI